MAEVEGDGDVDGPVDFTIKSEHSSPPPSGDMTDMAAFLASAAAAVRTSNQVDIKIKPGRDSHQTKRRFTLNQI